MDNPDRVIANSARTLSGLIDKLVLGKEINIFYILKRDCLSEYLHLNNLKHKP
jgi:hypothetical protein